MRNLLTYAFLFNLLLENGLRTYSFGIFSGTTTQRIAVTRRRAGPELHLLHQPLHLRYVMQGVFSNEMEGLADGKVTGKRVLKQLPVA